MNHMVESIVLDNDKMDHVALVHTTTWLNIIEEPKAQYLKNCI